MVMDVVLLGLLLDTSGLMHTLRAFLSSALDCGENAVVLIAVSACGVRFETGPKHRERLNERDSVRIEGLYSAGLR